MILSFFVASSFLRDSLQEKRHVLHLRLHALVTSSSALAAFIIIFVFGSI